MDQEMDKMLKTNQVSVQAIVTLAEKIAAFHQKAMVVTDKPDIGALKSKFNDLAWFNYLFGFCLLYDVSGD